MITEKKLNLFSLILGNILKMNISISSALQLATGEIHNYSLKKFILSIQTKITNAKSLSMALESYKLPGQFFCFVKAGELSEKLSESLLKYNQFYQEKLKDLKKIKLLLFYPFILLILSMIFFLILNRYFLTVFKSEYVVAHVNDSAKIINKIYLLLTSHYIVSITILILLCIIWFFREFILRIDLMKKSFDLFIVKIPILNNLIWNFNLSIFCFISGHLLKVDLPAVKSFELAANSMNNSFIKKHIIEITKDILTNKKIFISNKNSKVSAILIHTMVLGVKNENLDRVMSEISNLYFENYKLLIERIKFILPSILIIILGILIGFLTVCLMATYWSYGLFLN